MKKKKYSVLLLCVASLFAVSCNSSGENGNHSSRKYSNVSHHPISIAMTHYAEQYPVFSVADTAFDFGNIHEGDVVQYNFKFKNTGSKPLVISSASSTCGCTIPKFPKEPIAPGKEGVLKVVFNSAGKSGSQFKPIFITANTMPAHFKLKITCNVTPASK